MSSAVLVELKATASKFHAEMAKARSEIVKLNTEGSGNMKELSTVGKYAFLGLAGAAAAGAAVAVKSAGDYQESLTQLVTGAGESEKSIKLVGDGMLRMAGQVGISARDLSKGMYLIESAGYHGANGLDVLRAAAEGAKVGGADMASVADGLTTALNDYRLPASQAATVTSQLVETVASGKTHMADLSAALATVLPAAASAHVGLAQVLGAMATMTASGTPAADAATYLRQTIAQLSNPTAKAAHEMKSLGLSAIDISSNMGKRGLTGTMDLLTSAIEKHMGPAGVVLIEQMKKASGSTTAFQKILANLPPTQQTFIGALATMVGGTKSMQAALELTGGNAKTFASNVQAISATTTEAGGHVKGFALTQKDMNAQIDNARAAFSSLAIELGQKIIPAVGAAARLFNEHRAAASILAFAIGTVLVGAIAVYLTNMTVATAKSIAAFAADVAAGGRWVATKALQYGLAAADSITAAASATAAWVAANAAMIAGVGAVILVVAGAALLIIKYHREIWRAVVDVWHAIENAARVAVGGIIGFFTRMRYAVAAVAAVMVAVMTGGLGVIVAATVGAAAAIIGYHEQIMRAVIAVWDRIVAVVRGVVNAIVGFFRRLPGEIIGAVSGLPAAFLSLGESAARSFLQAFTSIPGKVGGLLGGALKHLPGAGLLSHIPGFAEGGLVTGPTLALVGEAGPELITPLSRLGRGSPSAAQVTVNVVVQGSVTSEMDLAATIRQHLLREARRVGSLGLA